MLRTATLAALPLLALVLVPACASSGDADELSGEAEDSVGGKADAAPEGAYTYFAITSDLRRCAAPMCGGFHLDRLNATSTTCHDGTKGTSCYAPVLDWSETSLTAAQQDTLVGAASVGAVSEGVTAIDYAGFVDLVAEHPTSQTWL